MITGQLSAELSATCSALGHDDGLTYHIDPYCRETIKDLIRYLRKDDEEHSIRRYLGSSKILQSDLVPILIHHSDKEDLFDVVLRVLMNLTTPALIVYQEQIPADKTERNHYLQIISQLQDYKQAFVKPEIWKVLAQKLGQLLEMEMIERDEDASRMMERILILARNVLAVPSDAEYEKRPDNDATIHDKVLWAMHESNLDEIFLYIASSDKEQQVYMHILEIVSLMLREQNPTVLATSEIQRSFAEKEKDEEELLAFRQAEITNKQMKVKKYAGARHGRFGGTFVMQGVKAAGDRDLIFHKPLEKAVCMDFNFEKKRIKWPKNLKPLKQVSEERRSTFGVRLFLKEFCVDLLNGAYNPLMRRVKDIIERGKSQGDESYYFWAMKFFMEFNRSNNFQVKLVSETVSIETFHFVQTQLENWNDLMTTDKKKIPLWSRRMHLALNAYQELLLTLVKMDQSPDEAVRSSSKVLKSRVFYVTEYRDLLVILTHVFKENRFSKMYMKELIETIHIFMKLLEHFSDKNRGIVVQQKKRVVQRKKKSAKSKQIEVNLEAVWDQVGPQLSAVLQCDAQIPTDIVPFDAASDMEMEEQKVEAMKRIQSLLKNGDFEEAVGLIRASREVWPENDCFGSQNMAADEEFMAMREIFMADLGQPGAVGLLNRGEAGGEVDNEEDEQEAFEAQNTNVGYQEQDMKFVDFVRRFISEKTIQICCLLLSKFEENTPYTNHCLIKLLHRISWDCQMPAMLFQASLFRIFQRAMESPKAEHRELKKFAQFIVQKFLQVAENNSKVFIEMLFWKKVKDAVEITDGYGSYKTKTHSNKNMWTEEQENELRVLHSEYERDNPGPNPVDWIMKNLINQERSRASIIKKLKELGFITNQKKMDVKISVREWSEAEIEQLRELVPRFMETENPMDCIMLRLMGNRSKKTVIQKILDLGLVTDRKQLRKKRACKSNNRADGSDNEIASSNNSSSDDDDGEERRGQPKPAKKERRRKQKTTNRNSSSSSSNEMVEALNTAVAAGFHEPLEWLISSLNDTIEDLEDDDETDVPLLPLTQDCTLAMDDATFLRALEAIGIKCPSDEQEIYWRIPGVWKEFRIRQVIQHIRDSLDGKLVPTGETDGKAQKKKERKKAKKPAKAPETFKEILENIDRNGESDAGNSDGSLEDSRIVSKAGSSSDKSDSDNGSALNSSFRRSSQHSSNSDDDSSSERPKTDDDSRKKKESKFRKLMLDSSSDDDNEEANSQGQKRQSKSLIASQSRRKRVNFDSSSDEDNKQTNSQSKSPTVSQSQRSQSKSPTSSQSQRKRTSFDSSSDEENERRNSQRSRSPSRTPTVSQSQRSQSKSQASSQPRRKRASFDSSSDEESVRKNSQRSRSQSKSPTSSQSQRSQSKSPTTSQSQRSQSKSLTASQSQRSMTASQSSQSQRSVVSFDSGSDNETTQRSQSVTSNHSKADARKKQVLTDSSSDEGSERNNSQRSFIGNKSGNIDNHTQKSESENNVSQMSVDELDNEKENSSSLMNDKNKRKRISVVSSSDDSDSQTYSREVEIVNKSQGSSKKINKKKKRLVIDSGSEDDDNKIDDGTKAK